jgi:hypothetical protein
MSFIDGGDDPSTFEKIQDEIGEQLAQIVGRHESGFVTKWVAVVESVGEDGKVGLWLMCGDQMKAWDTLGMLNYALNEEQARAVQERLSPE